MTTILLFALIHTVASRYALYESEMTWSDANQYCIDNHGSTLATITSDAEATEIKDLVGSADYFWIGLNDVATEGTWVWASGYECDGDCKDLDWWYGTNNQPNNDGGNEDCAEFMGTGSPYLGMSVRPISESLNDQTCSAARKFICDEYPLSTTTVVAAEEVCFSATEFVTDYVFYPPLAGNVVGVTLEHLSGGITCYTGRALTNWGCDNEWFMLSLSSYPDIQPIYPTETTEGITTYSLSSSCSCGLNTQMSNYVVNSQTLVWMDEANPIWVSKTQGMSLQTSEGCCQSSHSDNAGTSCAKVSFHYRGFTSSSPSTSPTMAPSRCDGDNMYKANWHNMLNEDDSADDLVHGSSIEFDAATLSLTFSASLEYVGLSADGSWSDAYDLGTTYWVDFQSFTESADDIDDAGSCGNRRESDYGDLSFADYWGYTADPLDLAAAETSERMAYPPSDWTLGVDAASSCNVVKYERSFSWTDLTACSSAAGAELITVTQNEDTVELTGTLFVELVSPYSMSTTGYYRTFPLIQQDFGIVLDRQVDVLASTGVQLFISSVIAYSHIEKEDESTAYTVTILTQSADYVMFDAAMAISTPDGVTVSDITTVTDGCLVASSFTCGQIFTVTIPAACSSDDDVIDLSGNYQFGFTPQCQTINGVADAACTTFMTTLSGDGKVALDVGAVFVDPCSINLFAVTFTGALKFYTDSAFTAVVGDDSAPFVIGQDTIYGKVTVDTLSDASGAIYDFVDVSIVKVLVCTAADGADVDLETDSGIGGCLSESIDPDGPYNVIGTGAVADYVGTVYTPSGAEATFSFLTFDTPRESIMVHVQLLLTVVEQESGDRRRMLLQANSEGNAFKSYIGTASVQKQDPDASIASVQTDGVDRFPVGLVAAVFGFVAWIVA